MALPSRRGCGLHAAPAVMHMGTTSVKCSFDVQALMESHGRQAVSTACQAHSLLAPKMLALFLRLSGLALDAAALHRVQQLCALDHIQDR